MYHGTSRLGVLRLRINSQCTLYTYRVHHPIYLQGALWTVQVEWIERIAQQKKGFFYLDFNSNPLKF